MGKLLPHLESGMFKNRENLLNLIFRSGFSFKSEDCKISLEKSLISFEKNIMK